MNQTNPYESTEVEQPKKKNSSSVVFLVLAGLTLLCMLLFFSLFLGVSRVQTTPVVPVAPAPAVQPTVVNGN